MARAIALSEQSLQSAGQLQAPGHDALHQRRAVPDVHGGRLLGRHQGAEAVHRLEDAPRVDARLGETAPELASSVELNQFLVKAPPALREAAAAQNAWVCLVTATAFEDTPEAARRALQPLEQGPVEPLSRTTATPIG